MNNINPGFSLSVKTQMEEAAKGRKHSLLDILINLPERCEHGLFMIKTGLRAIRERIKAQVLMNVKALASGYSCIPGMQLKYSYARRKRRDASFILSDLQNFIKTTTARLSGQSGKVGKLTRLQEKKKENNKVLITWIWIIWLEMVRNWTCTIYRW